MRPLEAVLLLLCASHSMLGIDARGHRIRLNTYDTNRGNEIQNNGGDSRASSKKPIRGVPIRGRNNVFGDVDEGEGSYEPDALNGYYSWDETSTRNIDATRGKQKNRKPKRGRMEKDRSRQDYDNVVLVEESSEDPGFVGEQGTGFSTKTPSAPAQRPTDKPTPRPSREPTPEPTNVATPRPTNRPTPNPTPEITEAPTFYPSQKPVETPRPTIITRPPTERPTPNPTQPPEPEPQPTGTDVPIPPAPSTAFCRSDADGAFGSMNGKSTEVDYLYQIELFLGLSIQDATAQVEQELVDLLLPKMFPQQCRLRRKLQAAKAAYVGISTMPSDSHIPGFACVGNFVEPCFVVRGWVTVYSVNIPPDTVATEVSGYIYDILESGQIEEEIMDVHRIRSLRAPSMMESPNNPEKVPVASAAVSNSAGTQSSPSSNRLPPASNNPLQAGIVDSPLSSMTSTNPPLQTNEPSENTSFLLRIPWWLWLLMLLFILVLWALMAAVEKKLELRKESESEEKALALEKKALALANPAE
ncbi:Hemolysin-type calcium-binding repeat (2 copies) [Seminavis robusta]|uniref:Hemolysin-type calcium-binding repeat (2 copies) n=1 Tax=Seminavis robusta TaxID=568900 RepID=A0A9N8H5M8_9STRA|nr:Hemolysin-type calcium-binding repeat (2 copies) [Seminavis robusta]|eukprot:Sro26_g017920.1 Hemolysin-type calcium-binding repeat (2 copies) (528) ;mRNA; f:160220-161876